MEDSDTMHRTYDHPLTKADVVALMVSLGKEALAWRGGERCPRCECLVAITAAALWTRFTREELQRLHADLKDA